MGSCSIPASNLPNHWWICSSQRYVEHLPPTYLQHCFLGSGAQAMRNSRHVSFLVPFVSINEQLRRGPSCEDSHGLAHPLQACNHPKGLRGFLKKPLMLEIRTWQTREAGKREINTPIWIIMHEGITLRTHKSYNVFMFEFFQSQVAACRIVPGLPWISISLIVLLTLGLRHFESWSWCFFNPCLRELPVKIDSNRYFYHNVPHSCNSFACTKKIVFCSIKKSRLR